MHYWDLIDIFSYLNLLELRNTVRIFLALSKKLTFLHALLVLLSTCFYLNQLEL